MLPSYRNPSPLAANLREVVRQFTPNWFAVTMGTGILALALNQLPLAIPYLHQLAAALWLLNIGLFLLFSLLYATRWVLFFHEARRIFGHSVMSMFFGTIPMGLATIINGFLAFGIPRWGGAAVTIAEALWWVDMVMALVCGVVIPFLMFTRQDHSLEKMTAIWLLPVVAAEVTAASAGQLVPHLADPAAALHILVMGYALWAFSVPIAMSMLVILLQRLVTHKLPHRDMAASGWLALGPLGTGALALLLLGADAPRVFQAAGMAGVGAVAQGLGIIGGVAMWGYGAWWMLIAVLTTARYLHTGMPFNLGWWGFTFPIGVYAVATLALGRQTNIAFFSSLGTALVVVLTVLWVVIATLTLRGAWQRRLFVSPCLIRGSILEDLQADAI
jgi:C4-dicarboxylate transporter/malic acid transport protein